MQHQNHTLSSGYRIKKYRNNFTSQEIHQDSDQRKKSGHSSSHQSPLKKSRNNYSISHKANQDRHSARSKRTSQTKNNLSGSSMSGSGQRIQPSTKIKQFANVKQLLMIKAYDKKLLRKVTGSNQANKNFLKMGDIKNDPFRMETFKVMVENFKEMVTRIQRGYQKVLGKILFQNNEISALATFASVKPTLMKVREQADNMFYKVKQCQQAHDSREFRNLLSKFQAFLHASQEIQNIIIIVNQSKNRIDGLFKDLEKDTKLDRKINHERNKGIKKVRKVVGGHQKQGLQAEILDRVEAAINEMADKTLQAFSHINGARGLMTRIKQCLRQNRDFYELEDIVKINQIFKQILFEANEYEKFSEKFLEDDDSMNDDLRNCILKYRQEVDVNRKAVYTMQLKFISNILESSVLTFEGSYSVCNAIDSTVCEDYKKVQTLLEDICQFLSDQNAKMSIQSMLRDIKPRYKVIQKLIQKLQTTPEVIYIDTSQGLQNIASLSETIQQYKQNVRLAIERQERAHKEITRKKLKRQILGEVDLEQQCIAKILNTSQKFNDPNMKRQIQNCATFKDVPAKINIEQLALETGKQNWYKQLKDFFVRIEQIQKTNELSTIVKQVKVKEKLYEMSPLLLQVYTTSMLTTQSNIIQQITKITDFYKKGHLFQSASFTLFFQRIFCQILVKGLSKKLLSKVSNHNMFQFPNNQHDIQSYYTDIKYLKTLTLLFPQIKIKEFLQLSYQTAESIIEGAAILQSVKWNHDGLYFIPKGQIFALVNQRFSVCVLHEKEKKQNKNYERLNLEQILVKLNKIVQNLSTLKSQQNSSKLPKNRTQRTLQIISHYNLASTTLLKSISSTLTIPLQESYSQLAISCCKYLQETHQSFYATLNQQGCVLWICEWAEISKNSRFGQFIGLPSIKCGKIVKKHNDKAIKSVNAKPKQKEVKKKSKKINDQMQQQIVQQSEDIMIESLDEDMSEDIRNSGQVEDMIEQYEDQSEKISEMGEEIIGQNSMIEDIVDEQVQVEDEVDDQFDFEEEEQKGKNNGKVKGNNKIENKDIVQNVNNKSVQKPFEPVKLILVPLKTNKTFQIFKYAKSLQDLQILLRILLALPQTYYCHIDIKQIQKYYNSHNNSHNNSNNNSHNSNRIKQKLQQNLQKLVRQKFSVDLLLSIKNAQNYKSIIRMINLLVGRDRDAFAKILEMQNKSYSLFVNYNQQVIKTSVMHQQYWNPQIVVQQFLSQYLPFIQQTLSNFSLSQYVSALQTTSKQKSTIYKILSIELSPSNSLIEQKLAQINKIIGKYKLMENFPDGLPLSQVIVSLWAKCVGFDSGQANNLEVPTTLKQDILALKEVDKKQNLIHYIINLKQASKQWIKKLEEHQNTLQQVFTKTQKSSLIYNISTLINIYKCKPQQIVYYSQKPLLYTNQNNNKNSNCNELYLVILNIFNGGSPRSEPDMQEIFVHIKQQLQNKKVHNECIYKMLQILSIQTHVMIEPIICVKSTEAQIYNSVISYVSNDGIKTIEQLTDNVVGNSMLVQKASNSVKKYVMKGGEKMMDRQYNHVYYQSVTRMSKDIEMSRRLGIDIGCCVWQALVGLQNSEGSSMRAIRKYEQDIKHLLSSELFVQQTQSIFKLHKKTQQLVSQMKVSLQQQLLLISGILNNGVEAKGDLGGIQQETEQMGNVIMNWYNRYGHKEKLNKVYIQFSMDMDDGQRKEQKLLIYVGQSMNQYFKYLGFLLGRDSYDIKQYKKWIQNTTQPSGAVTIVIDVSGIIQHICLNEVRVPSEIFINFVSNYNQVYFICSSNQNLKQSKQALVDLQNIEAFKQFHQASINLQRNQVIQNIITDCIQKQLGDLTQLQLKINNNKQILQSINIQTLQYQQFYEWFMAVLIPQCTNTHNQQRKQGGMQCIFLEDLTNDGTVLCVFCVKNEGEISNQLCKLSLPNQFVIKHSQINSKTISISPQEITLSLNPSIILPDQLKILTSTQTTPSRALYFYQKCSSSTSLVPSPELKLLRISPLTATEIKLPIQLSAFTLNKNIYVKLQDVSLQSSLSNSITSPTSPISPPSPTPYPILDQSTHIVCCLKSEQLKDVKIGSNVYMDSISKQVKRLVLKKIEHQKRQIQKKEQQKKERIRKQQQQKQKELDKERQRIREEQEKQKVLGQQFLLSPPSIQPKSLKQFQQVQNNDKQFISDTSINNYHFTQTDQYLNNLYKRLAEDKIYTIPKNYKPNNQDNSNKNDSNNLNDNQQSIPIFTSAQDTALYVSTKKTLKKQLQNYPSNATQQSFKQISQNYLQQLEHYIKQRENILNQVLQIAIQKDRQGHKLQKIPQANIKGIKQILQQMKQFQGWRPEIEGWVIKALNNLSQENKILVTAIYGQNEINKEM